MSPSDRIAMLSAMGVRLELTADRKNIHASGAQIILDIALPTLRRHDGELAAHLRATLADEYAHDVLASASVSPVDVRVLSPQNGVSQDDTSTARA